MIFACSGVYDDIVHESDHSPVEYISKYMVYLALECRRGIDQPEGHYFIFKLSISVAECGFPFVSFFDADEVITVFEVDFGIPV